MMNDILYSFRNASAVAEKMEQLNDILKLLTAGNDEFQHLLTEDELLQIASGLKSSMFSFKRKIIKWVKEAELKTKKLRLESQWGLEAVNPEAVSHQVPAMALLDQASKIKQ